MAANTLYLVTAAFTFMGVRVPKGITLALTPAQVTLVGAANVRAVNAPINTNGTAPSSPTHDTLGEGSGVSNSS